MLPTPKNIEYRPDIDGLRAIAILAVVLYHGFPKNLPGGFIGVDIFFVISGYLISNIILYQTSQHTFSLATFYYHRARRILPALSVVLAYCCVIGWLLQLPWELEALGKSLIAGIFFLSNILLWQQAGYFDATAQEKPLMHLWSLGIEEQFYIVWPILLALIIYRKRNATPIILATILLSWLLNIALISQNQAAAAFFLPFSRAGELAIGALLALDKSRPASVFRPWPATRLDILSVAGLLLLIASIAGTRGGRHFPGLWSLPPTVATAMLIAAGPHALVNRYLLQARLLVGIGLISYPLYLWHWPLLTLPNPFGLHSANSIRNSMLPLSFLLAWMTYRLLEKPVRTLPASKKHAGYLLLPLLPLAIAGLLFWMNHGYPDRFPAAIRDIARIEKHGNFSYQVIKKDRICQNRGTHSMICRDDDRPDILLWGDSHASALYPGLDMQRHGRNMSITVATGCGSPPLISPLRYTDQWCDTPSQRFANNLRTLDDIGKLQPKIVILHARWAYEHYGLSPQRAVQELQKTVLAINIKSPETVSVVLGPVPNWSYSLAKSMFNYWQKTPGHPLPPQYMRFGLDSSIEEWDKQLAIHAQQAGLHYISAYRLLCNTAGCLTRAGPAPTDITAVDYGHLSPAGARYLVAKIMPQLDQLATKPQ